MYVEFHVLHVDYYIILFMTTSLIMLTMTDI